MAKVKVTTMIKVETNEAMRFLCDQDNRNFGCELDQLVSDELKRRGIDFSALAESDLVSLTKPPQETE